MKLETKSSDKFRSFFVKFGLPFSKWGFQFRMDFFLKPSEWVKGYSSRTENGRYVLFHDYDNLTFAELKEELLFLQEKFKLSDYYVFKLDRENSFHAVCLDTFDMGEAYNIQKTTSADLAFIHSIKTLKTKEWVLRYGSKGKRSSPEFFAVISSEFDSRVKSSAHANFLRAIGVPVSLSGLWDRAKMLTLVNYDTANRID